MRTPPHGAFAPIPSGRSRKTPSPRLGARLALSGLAGAAVLAAAATAGASDLWALQFSGAPVGADVILSDLSTNPYVSFFSMPAIRDMVGETVLDTPANEDLVTLLSTVSLSPSGGSIHVFPSANYVSFYDGSVYLDINYTLSAPQPIGGRFVDNNITGTGFYRYYVNASYGHPGVRDRFGSGTFSLTSLSAAVPEPAQWTLLILGFAAIGALTRHRRFAPA